jgi:hypothetical protein
MTLQDALVPRPTQIAPDQQFFHPGMMGIFHQHNMGIEAMPLGQGAHLIGVIIDHQEIASQRTSQCEQSIVI